MASRTMNRQGRVKAVAELGGRGMRRSLNNVGRDRMPSLRTRFFGVAEYGEDSVIRILSGLPPFVNQTRYLLLVDERRHPLAFLQSVDEPGLCFLTLPVESIDSGYEARFEGEDLALIGCEDSSKLTCLAILTFAEDGTVTANLMAPVLIDPRTRVAVQAIRRDGRYSHAVPLSLSEAKCSS